MAFQPFFPFTPNGMSWEDWNGNLIMFYGQEPVAYNSEENWKETARGVAQLTTFEVYPVPSPDVYENWQDWALEFTEIINGTSV
jgi:hypothetical protein